MDSITVSFTLEFYIHRISVTSSSSRTTITTSTTTVHCMVTQIARNNSQITPSKRKVMLDSILVLDIQNGTERLLSHS